MTEISTKYERLIQDLRGDFRPQREWGEGRGVFLVVGHFLVGVAAGAWLFGLAFSYTPGLAIAFLLAEPAVSRTSRSWVGLSASGRWRGTSARRGSRVASLALHCSSQAPRCICRRC